MIFRWQGRRYIKWRMKFTPELDRVLWSYYPVSRPIWTKGLS